MKKTSRNSVVVTDKSEAMASASEEETQNRLLQVHGQLTDDVLAADLQWSFVVSAESSYRHDTVLMPFPPMFTKETSESHDNKKLVCNFVTQKIVGGGRIGPISLLSFRQKSCQIIGFCPKLGGWHPLFRLRNHGSATNWCRSSVCREKTGGEWFDFAFAIF